MFTWDINEDDICQVSLPKSDLLAIGVTQGV
jgi:hypothetical protein